MTEYTDLKFIIDDLLSYKKQKEICKLYGINRYKLNDIIKQNFNSEQFNEFKIKRSDFRNYRRKEKYQEQYHNDLDYRKRKQKQALIRYYIKRHEYEQQRKNNK